MRAPLDQAKRDQLRDHIAGLDSAALSVEAAAGARPAGVDRDNMIGLARRLRSSADGLRNERERLLESTASPTRGGGEASTADVWQQSS